MSRTVTAKSPFEAKADHVLALADAAAETARTYHDVWNAAFGVGGPAFALFPDQGDRDRFRESGQYARIVDLLDAMRTGGKAPGGQISARVPRSLHASLLAEADREGTSLNQLCLAKLSLPLAERLS